VPRKKRGGMPRVIKLEAMSRESGNKPEKIATKIPKGPMFPKDRVATAKPKSVPKAPSAPKAVTEKFPKAPPIKEAKARGTKVPKAKKI
jgi:hypothetical protein